MDALRELYCECRAGRLCAVTPIRGGGTAADLAYLVDHKLAETVCRRPVPVLTGIGHERDHTPLDEVRAARRRPSSQPGYPFKTSYERRAASIRHGQDRASSRTGRDAGAARRTLSSWHGRAGIGPSARTSSRIGPG